MGETGNLGWIAHVPMIVAPWAPRNIDEFTSEQETQVVAGLFRLIVEFLAECEAAASA